MVKRLIQGRNNVTRMRVEPRSFDQGRRKNDAFTHSATLLTTASEVRDAIGQLKKTKPPDQIVSQTTF